MTYPAKGYGTYGPDPWHQTSWDARAAGNFIGGGMGSGLIVFALLSGATGAALAALLLAGLALVGLGLFCVSLELGRPLRALNVFRNPRTSWMAREAWTSVLLVPATLAAAAGVPGVAWLALALALAFVHCQARLLQAAKGIAAWREPMIAAAARDDGARRGGRAAAAGHARADPGPHVARRAARRPRARALDVLAPVSPAGRRETRAARGGGARSRGARAAARWARWCRLRCSRWWRSQKCPACVLPAVALGGLAATAAGAYLKLVLVTRAGFNQGFSLPHLPVRGTRS